MAKILKVETYISPNFRGIHLFIIFLTENALQFEEVLSLVGINLSMKIDQGEAPGESNITSEFQRESRN